MTEAVLKSSEFLKCLQNCKLVKVLKLPYCVYINKGGNCCVRFIDPW